MEDKAKEKNKLVAGVQYRHAGKIYTFLTEDGTLKRGERVVVESEQGTSLGVVIMEPQAVSGDELPEDIKKVLRRASEEEIKRLVDQNEREFEIFELFCEKVKEQNLPMKPLAAELREGEKKIVLTFFAEERVDFRNLVKDLATSLHLRIEMHQIGARDEVKYRGGVGPCGLLTCCSQHLRQFQSISIQMAKNQGLTPNPAKLTGLCNKLKCCLAYENPLYAEIRQRLPRIGMSVKVPQGNGKVTGLDILKENCVVRLDDGVEVRVHFRDVTPQSAKPEEQSKEEAAGHAEIKKPEGAPKPRAEEPRRGGGEKRGRRRRR